MGSVQATKRSTTGIRMSQGPTQEHGRQATRLLARPRIIARTLLRQSAVSLILLFPPFAFALVEREWQLVAATGVPALVAVAVHFSTRGKPPPEDLRRVEAVLVLVFIFLLSCIMTFPSFLVLGMNPVDAIFEATSAVTTTGLSVAANVDDWPVSAHVLRAWTQWCGGLVMAIAGLALLLRPGPTSRILGSVEIDERNILSSTRFHARQLLLAYLALSAFGVVGAGVLVPGYWEGPVLALAAVSTGGFAPRTDSLASYSLAAKMFLVLLSLLGSMSLLVYVVALKTGLTAALNSAAIRVFGRVILFSTAVYVVVHVFFMARIQVC